MVEIERKFLIKSSDFKKNAISKARITQGFLSTDPERTVRIRIYGQKGFITIKGKGNATGTTRFEWEKEINLKEAKQLLSLCKKGIIDKTRYTIPAGNHTVEVDEFFGENSGLIIAEIELTHEHEQFERPIWLGEEITGDKKYYNSQLSKHPFVEWSI